MSTSPSLPRWPLSTSPPPSDAGTRARNSRPSPFAATSKAETSKHSKYDRPVTVTSMNLNPPLKFVAIAFSD